MFTGIIEELGTVKDMSVALGKITIRASKVLENTRLGDSIAVNGICLTVTSMTADGFTADVMPETIKRTSLSVINRGDKVNLERAMAADGRFGGHIVSGHVDGTGHIAEFRNDNNAVWVRIKADEPVLDLIVEKGSIAIDGISLTVAVVTDEYFEVSIIPHTAGETTLLTKHVGDPVNLENDVVGKYVAKLLFNNSLNKKADNRQESSLTMEMLADFLS